MGRLSESWYLDGYFSEAGPLSEMNPGTLGFLWLMQTCRPAMMSVPRAALWEGIRCSRDAAPQGRLGHGCAFADNQSLFAWRLWIRFLFFQQENHLKIWNILRVILLHKMVYIKKKSLLWISEGNKEWIIGKKKHPKNKIKKKKKNQTVGPFWDCCA